MQKLQLGKYTLINKLGEGEFGAVFKAKDETGRIVAIKVLKPVWSSDPKVNERFLREAKAASNLYHPQIATTLDYGHDRGFLYLVMRYIEGKSLNEIISQRGRLSWNEATTIISQIAGALEYAHQRGFVHRDIKPANIVISESDGAVLTDFGLIKATSEISNTTTGVIMGTPSYLAPEIWEGREVTPQTDIYSLGCVFFEMLLGEKLFEGSSAPLIMKKHMLEGPRFPDNWPEDVPVGIETLLRKALAQKPEDRYRNAGELEAALKLVGMTPGLPEEPIGKAGQPAAEEYQSAETPGIQPRIEAVVKPGAVEPAKGHKRKLDKRVWLVSVVVIVCLCMVATTFIGYQLLNPTASIVSSATNPSVISSPFPIEVVQPTLPLTEEAAPTSVPTTQPTDTLVPTIEATATETPTLAPTPTPLFSTLFEDNFENGLSPMWQVITGKPIIVNGTLTTDQELILAVGEPGWVNYKVEFEITPDDCWRIDVTDYVGVHAADPANMAAYDFGKCTGAWYLVSNGIWNEIPNSEAEESAHAGINLYKMYIAVEDGNYTAAIEDKIVSSFFDTSYPSGFVVVRLDKESRLDNFRIIQLP